VIYQWKWTGRISGDSVFQKYIDPRFGPGDPYWTEADPYANWPGDSPDTESGTIYGYIRSDGTWGEKPNSGSVDGYVAEYPAVSAERTVEIQTAPTVTSITRQSPTGQTTNEDEITFRVSFSRDVNNVGTDDVAVARQSGDVETTVESVTAESASEYDVTVALGAGEGELRLDMDDADGDIADDAGNTLLSTSVTGDETYVISDTVDPGFQSSDTASINEDATGPVLTVDAIDDAGDGDDVANQYISYSLSSASGSDADAFSIDSDTGELSLDSPKDFESPTDADAGNDYELMVTATDDGGNTNEQMVSVSITDVNEPPTQPVDADGASNRISESATSGDDVGIDANTDDPEDDTITWSLTDDANGRFQIDSSGVVTVADGTALNYEDETSHMVTVRADDGEYTATKSFTVTVTDADETPIFTSSGAVSIREDATNGEQINDVDANVGGSPDEGVSYAISSGNRGEAFSIDSETGKIAVADNSQFDYEDETIDSFTLTVAANEGERSETQSVSITVQDADEAPTFTSDGSGSATEDATSGTQVHDVDAHVGGDTDEAVTYAITAGNDGEAFNIDSSTGEIEVVDSTQFDHEGTGEVDLTVEASEDSESTIRTVTVTITDVTETPVFAAGPADSNTVAEDATGGAPVHDVDAHVGGPPDEGVRYEITSSNRPGAFNIDSTTGEIEVEDSSQLDHEDETMNSATLTVVASEDEERVSQAVTITVTDANEIPTITSESSGSVSESASGGTVVHDVDADVGGSADEGVSYSITNGNTGAAYTIDSSGQITVANPDAVDRERTASYTLTVEASEGDQRQTQNVSIAVRDVEERPSFTSDAAVTLAEDATDNEPVHDVDARVGGPQDVGVNYTIASGNEMGAFRIDRSSGQITVADSSQFDYEGTNSFTLTVRASEGKLNQTQPIAITITDVDEAPTFTSDGAGSIAEDATSGEQAHDVNTTVGGHPDEQVTYTITAGNDAGAFEIDTGNGQIDVVDPTQFDHEGTSEFTLTVEASEGNGVTTRDITITVTDVNETPTFVNSGPASIVENATVDTLVHNVDAHVGGPADAGVNYHLTGGNADNAYEIDTDGHIVVADPSMIDYERSASRTVTVKAYEGKENTTQNITIDVTDVDEVPAFTSHTSTNVSENATSGEQIHDVDANVGGNPDEQVTYAFVAGNESGAFRIDSSTGKITIANGSQLDHENTSETIRIVEASEGNESATQNITITVTDVNETPSFVNSGPASIAENATVGISVHNVDAHVGGPADAGVSYRLSGGNADDAYAIDGDGQVTVATPDAIDHERSANRTLTVTASEGNHSATQEVSITVTDINETPTFSNSGPASVAEDATRGTQVHNVDASVGGSADDGVNYSIEGGNDDKAYAINESGVLTVRNPDAIDYEKSTNRTLAVTAREGKKSQTQEITVYVTDVEELSGTSGGGQSGTNPAYSEEQTGPTVSVTSLPTANSTTEGAAGRTTGGWVEAKSINISDVPNGERVRITLSSTNENETTDGGDTDISQSEVRNVLSDGLTIEFAEQGDFALTVRTRDIDLPGESVNGDLNPLSTAALDQNSRRFVRATGARPVGYIEVTPEFESEHVVEQATHRFRVRKSYLEALGVGADEVGLYREVDGEWQELPTRLVGEVPSFYEFEADTPGFSVFAIGTTAPVFEPGDASVESFNKTTGEVETSITIRNIGSTPGELTVPLTAGQAVLQQEAVSLEPGETANVTVQGVINSSGPTRVSLLGQNLGTVRLITDDEATETPTQSDSDRVTETVHMTETGDSPSVRFGVIGLVSGLFLSVVVFYYVVRD
jgi:hypothetical protein